MSKNHVDIFYKSDPSELPFDLVNSKSIGPCPYQTNQHVKYKRSVINSSQDNERNHVYIIMLK